MRINLHPNWNSINDAYELTREEIETQADNDLIKYKRAFAKKYGQLASVVLDVDNFVKEMWDIEVVFESLEQTPGEQTLGFFDPETKKIYIEETICENFARVNFTIAHEAGHISLHTSMLHLESGIIKGWDVQPKVRPKDKKSEIIHRRKEWQANKYAAALLAPKIELIGVLKELGLVSAGALMQPVDLGLHGKAFDQRFGLSRQALEIRFGELSIPIKNSKYPALTNRKAA